VLPGLEVFCLLCSVCLSAWLLWAALGCSLLRLILYWSVPDQG
jgi:hypothetical protein